ncbi:hypothetical protein HK097_009774 [Rhizophlyctis rosea]|uniref:Uncharacterized protein n=1 Tax=Rhizophlyctis rosea TaxID=64517 RepID=A0AAD5SHP6_9FUNG|nr:hypothetical protein HK097_009774 [Rhizophlyctis rosea]
MEDIGDKKLEAYDSSDNFPLVKAEASDDWENIPDMTENVSDKTSTEIDKVPGELTTDIENVPDKTTTPAEAPQRPSEPVPTVMTPTDLQSAQISRADILFKEYIKTLTTLNKSLEAWTIGNTFTVRAQSSIVMTRAEEELLRVAIQKAFTDKGWKLAKSIFGLFGKNPYWKRGWCSSWDDGLYVVLRTPAGLKLASEYFHERLGI